MLATSVAVPSLSSPASNALPGRTGTDTSTVAETDVEFDTLLAGATPSETADLSGGATNNATTDLPEGKSPDAPPGDFTAASLAPKDARPAVQPLPQAPAQLQEQTGSQLHDPSLGRLFIKPVDGANPADILQVIAGGPVAEAPAPLMEESLVESSEADGDDEDDEADSIDLSEKPKTSTAPVDLAAIMHMAAPPVQKVTPLKTPDDLSLKPARAVSTTATLDTVSVSDDGASNAPTGQGREAGKTDGTQVTAENNQTLPANAAQLVKDVYPKAAALTPIKTPELTDKVQPVNQTTAETPASNPAAQIAAPAQVRDITAEISVAEKNKNTAQVVSKKNEAKVTGFDGIKRAYDQSSMTANPSTFVNPAVSMQPGNDAAIASSKPVAELQSAAVKLVERVSEVADHLAANPAERVTVRIDLDGNNRVDVQVAMRGGRVHADFRSDSPEMREALSSAWETFSRTAEGGNRRWAEPVFSPMPLQVTPTSAGGSSQQSFGGSSSFGSGQDSARQQASEQAPMPRWSVTQTGTAASSTSVAAPSASAPTSDTSLHLSVLA